MSTIYDIMRTQIYDSSLSKQELDRLIMQRRELRVALRSCTYGDQNAKIYIKELIKDILLKKYDLEENRIDDLIQFRNTDLLSSQDKFEIILYHYRKRFQKEALTVLIQDYQLDELKKDGFGENYYEITSDQIDAIYYQEDIRLDFYDKLHIVSQRIYQLYRGNGVIDEIRDMTIDGVSAGVSGIPSNFEIEGLQNVRELPASYDSIWIFYKGKSIHLSFLSFQSEKELVRVCKNIYRYNNPGQLSEVMGYIVNEMKDGSRVAVARPPFCEGWVLFVRKFNQELQDDIRTLITDNNCIIPIQLMKWLIKGCQILSITGEQGAGKTTLLMSLVRYISPVYNLRVQELSFELHLRKLYPKRNIVSFRETENINGKNGLDFAKKTDGTVNILGEVASAPVASWMVMMTQVASLFTLFTHHAKTTKDLVYSLRNALLTDGGFHNENAATRQVIDAVRFDIHMRKHKDGHRFIERITEIIPCDRTIVEKVYRKNHEFASENELFATKDIVVYENGRYLFRNQLSEGVLRQIHVHLSHAEQELFEINCKEWEKLSEFE
ncbi:MAG TPA: ATPase, T2SS/T4P/T4SS family [Lachnospiraceae bacterium]|nr:ATPase, T2SS/T4P/T4SS family [Lachnospiraceae bacterium]